jgi:hypothetical protein
MSAVYQEVVFLAGFINPGALIVHHVLHINASINPGYEIIIVG